MNLATTNDYGLFFVWKSDTPTFLHLPCSDRPNGNFLDKLIARADWKIILII